MAFTVTVRAAIVDFKITALKVNKFHGEIELEIIFFFIFINTIIESHLVLSSLRPCGSRNFEIDSCRQHGFFILLQ